MWRELTERHCEIYSDPTIGGESPGRYFDEHLSRVGTENIWVAVAGSEVVALLGLIKREGEVEIEPIVVSSKYRNKEIGRMLVGIAFEEAKRLGATYVSVKPVARNVEAMRFFWDCGFKTLGHVELFADLGEKEWKSGLSLHDIPFSY